MAHTPGKPGGHDPVGHEPGSPALTIYDLTKTTRFARVYSSRASGKLQGYMKATIGAMHYESVANSGDYDTPIDLTYASTDTAALDGEVLDTAGYGIAIQTDVETGVQPDQGTVIFTGKTGNALSLKATDMTYLDTDDGAWTTIDVPFDYTTSAAVRTNHEQRNLGTFEGVDDVIVGAGCSVTWPDLVVRTDGINIDLQGRPEHGLLIIWDEAAIRNWFEANDPYLTPVETTRYGPLFEVDWSDIPRVYLADGTEVDPSTDSFDDTGGPITLRGSSNELIAVIPQAERRWNHGYEGSNGFFPLVQKHFWEDGGTTYMSMTVNLDGPSGLFDFNARHGWPFQFYTTDDLDFGRDGRGYYYDSAPTDYSVAPSARNLVTGATSWDAEYIPWVRFQPAIPNGASVTNIAGGEYATLRFYQAVYTTQSVQYPTDVDTSVDVFTDVFSSDQPKIPYSYHAYDVDHTNDGPWPLSATWTDSYTFSTMTTPYIATDGTPTPWPEIDLTYQLQENLNLAGFQEGSGLRIRMPQNAANLLTTNWGWPSGLDDVYGKQAVLDVFFTSDDGLRHKDSNLKHNDQLLQHQRTTMRHKSAKRHNN